MQFCFVMFKMLTWGILLTISISLCSTFSVPPQIRNDQCISESGKIYSVGSVFTDNDCTSKCECLKDGVVSCEPMCPVAKNDNSCARIKIVNTPVRFPDAQGKICSCPSFICEQESVCLDRGRTYQPGDSFISSDCTGSCVCREGGAVSCVSLCPPRIVRCNVDEIKVHRSRKIANSACTCPDWKCVKVKRKVPVPPPIIETKQCHDGEKTYQPGDRFISADCSGYCQCRPSGTFGCVSLCPPRFVTCATDEEKIKRSRNIANSNCTCPDWKCQKREVNVLQDQLAAQASSPRQTQKQQCISLSGKLYEIGQVFTDINCSSRCQCKDGGELLCQPLCMDIPKDSFCAKQNVVDMPIKLPDAEGRTCSCPLIMCEAYATKEQIHNVDKEFCHVGERKYKPGDRFITEDCHGSCVCGPGGSVSCVSLCPLVNIKCDTDEEQIYSSRRITNSNCTCPETQCVKRNMKDVNLSPQDDVCTVGDAIYKVGDRYVSSDCTDLCKCMPGKQWGCKNLCPIVDITCEIDEVKQQWSEQISGSKCSCPRTKCVKKPDEYCEIYGEKHKIGEMFVPKDCSGYCSCSGPQAYSCVSLCPPHGINCVPGTRKVRIKIPAFSGSNCTCPSWKCVKEVKNMWGPWSNWTKCDAKCGSGLRYRYRTCKSNVICSGPSKETEVCNTVECSPTYTDAPCTALRRKLREAAFWPRCDDQGYFEPLQCEPSINECRCVDRLGNVIPGSRRNSLIPQCYNQNDSLAPATP